MTKRILQNVFFQVLIVIAVHSGETSTNLDLFRSYFQAGETVAKQFQAGDTLITGTYTQLNQNFHHAFWQANLRNREGLNSIRLSETVKGIEFFADNGDYYSRNEHVLVNADPEEGMEPDPTQSTTTDRRTERYYVGGMKYVMQGLLPRDPQWGDSWSIRSRDTDTPYQTNERSLYGFAYSVYFGELRKTIDGFLKTMEEGDFILDLNVNLDEENQRIWFCFGVQDKIKYLEMEFSTAHPEKLLTYVRYVGGQQQIQDFVKYDYNEEGQLVRVRNFNFMDKEAARTLDDCTEANATIVFEATIETMARHQANPMSSSPLALIQDGDVVGDYVKNVRYKHGKPETERPLNDKG